MNGDKAQAARLSLFPPLPPANLFMNGPRAFTQGTCVPSGERGLHLGEDGEGNWLGAVGPEIESDRGVEAGSLRGREGNALGGEIGEDLLGAFAGTEQTQIGEGTGEQVAEERHVVDVVMSHHDGDRFGIRMGLFDQGLRRPDDEGRGGRETLRGRECRPWVGNRHPPAQFVGEPGEGLGVVAGPENQKGCGRRDYVRKKPVGVGAIARSG